MPDRVRRVRVRPTPRPHTHPRRPRLPRRHRDPATPQTPRPHTDHDSATQIWNRSIATLRVAVERAIAHWKNWKILATGYRGRLAELPNLPRIVTALEYTASTGSPLPNNAQSFLPDS
ncbi:transposase family protein [Actinophytocola sp. KF-1]